MTNPKVTFIITSYNYEKYIENAINSVLNQSVQDFEIIVADDGSTDNSVKIIKSLIDKDNRIKLIQNTKNLGLKKTLQNAIKSANGEWIAFLETDDLITPDYLEEKFAIAEKYHNVGFIFNGIEFTGENKETAQNKFKNIVKKCKKSEFPKNMFYDFGFENRVLTMSSVMVRKDLLSDIDFNTPIDKLIDWYIYIQIAHKTDFYYINKPLTKWMQHNNSYVSKNKKIKFKFANIASYINIYKKHPANLKLLIFTLFSIIRMCMKRLKVYIFKTN